MAEYKKLLKDILVDQTTGAVASLEEIDGIGHRVVHGGEKFTSAALIDDAVYHNASMEEQKCPKKIWWSNSYGIVKYETRDNKIWERILN